MAITPVALIADGRQIARFEKGSFEFPWFTAPMKGLVRKHRDWLADVTRFNADMDAAEPDDSLGDDAGQTFWYQRLAEFRLEAGDLEIFSDLCVAFSDGSVHRIGPTYFEDGDLRWRNGEELKDEAAEFERSVTHTSALIDFCKAIFVDFVLQVIFFALLLAALAAWAAGWFG